MKKTPEKRCPTETPRPVHAGFPMKPPGKAGCPLLTLLTCYQSHHDLHLIPSIGVWGLWRRDHWIGNPPAKGSGLLLIWHAAWLNPPCLNNSDLGIEISAGDSRWLRWAHSKKMTFLQCWGQVMTALPHSSNLRSRCSKDEQNHAKPSWERCWPKEISGFTFA